MTQRRDPLILLVVLALFFAYPLSYTVLRASHVLKHTAFFVSAEGLDAHTVHGMDGNDPLQTLYKPLIQVELALHRRHKP